MARKLTVKQEAFCVAFAGECMGNATEAYLKAGYNVSEKTAGVNASRLLGKANIQARIEEIGKEVKSRKVMDVAEMQERLTSIARQEAEDYVILPTGEESKHKADLKAALKAMELLGKMKGAFLTRQEIDVRGAVPVVIRDDVEK